MTQLVAWLATDRGRLVSALMLFAAIAALERSPIVKGWLEGKPLAKRGAAVALAVLPAVAAALFAGLPLEQVSETAITAFLAATGLNAILPRKSPPPNVDALRAAGGLLVFLTACLPPAMPTPRFEACKARYDACVKDSATRSEYDECRDVVNTDCLDAPAPAASASAVSP